LTNDEWAYFSFNPDESTMTDFSGADIFAVPPMGPVPATVVDEIYALLM
jgi:hypothetical protein